MGYGGEVGGYKGGPDVASRLSLQPMSPLNKDFTQRHKEAAVCSPDL